MRKKMLMLFEFSQDFPPFLCLTETAVAAVAVQGSALLLPCTATTAAAVAVRHKKGGKS